MLKGFKDFLLRGNIVDLAVAFVVGSAFVALVTVFTKSFIDPLIGLIGGGGPNGMTVEVNGQFFTIGAFITALITFTLTVAVVYFAIVVPMKALNERRSASGEPEEVTEDVALLREIRDALQSR